MSVEERWVLVADKDISRVRKIMASLRDMRLSWLEAFVLVQKYWVGRTPEEVCAMSGHSLSEVGAADRSLLRKASERLTWLAAEQPA